MQRENDALLQWGIQWGGHKGSRGRNCWVKELTGLWLDKKQGAKKQKHSVSDSITIDLFIVSIVFGRQGEEEAPPTFTPTSLWLPFLLLHLQLSF